MYTCLLLLFLKVRLVGIFFFASSNFKILFMTQITFLSNNTWVKIPIQVTEPSPSP